MHAFGNQGPRQPGVELSTQGRIWRSAFGSFCMDLFNMRKHDGCHFGFTLRLRLHDDGLNRRRKGGVAPSLFIPCLDE